MFGMRKEPEPTATEVDNILGPNTSYNGTIKSDGNIRIEGIYQGHIETAGNVVVGPDARVVADIVANAVQIQGAVRGDINAKGRLEITSRGRVWGDVTVSALLIDEGGVFLGKCIMAQEDVEPFTLPEPVAQVESGLPEDGSEEEQASEVEIIPDESEGPREIAFEAAESETYESDKGTSPPEVQ